jgi:Transposase IS200 like
MPSLEQVTFRVPDRGSGNPTPLGGWDRGASRVNWVDGSVQAWQPYGLGLQIPLGVGDEVSLPRPWWGRRVRCRELLRETASAHEMVIHARSVNRDHVHMLLSIPPQSVCIARGAISEGTQFAQTAE